MGSTAGLGRSPGGGHGNPLQHYCPQNPTDRGLAGYSPQGHTESDTTGVTEHQYSCTLQPSAVLSQPKLCPALKSPLTSSRTLSLLWHHQLFPLTVSFHHQASMRYITHLQPLLPLTAGSHPVTTQSLCILSPPAIFPIRK